jgi:hypothetical protein
MTAKTELSAPSDVAVRKFSNPNDRPRKLAYAVPVELAARKSPKLHEPSCGLAVVLPGGRRIEVHPDFDTSTFKRLVNAPERV